MLEWVRRERESKATVTKWTSCSRAGDSLSSFCEREGSKIPSKILHIQPNPCTPVLTSCRIMRAPACPDKEQNRWGKNESSEVPLSRERDRNTGTGEERGANTRCDVREAETVTPKTETDPWTTTNP